MLGAMAVRVGGGMYLNACASVTDLPSGLVRTASTKPPAWGGAVKVTVVALTTVAVTEVPPMERVAPGRKFCPARVTAAPPSVVPKDGVALFSTGAGWL